MVWQTLLLSFFSFKWQNVILNDNNTPFSIKYVMKMDLSKTWIK